MKNGDLDPRTLNLHHLRYFWAVAKDGNLTRTAERWRVSQSALSTQIRQLEEVLGEPLFLRQGRHLELTEAGRLTLAHAEALFAQAEELVATLQGGRSRFQGLRIGAVATLSRNFQESFLRPLLGDPQVTLRLQSGRLSELLLSLERHELDVVLSNRAVREPGRSLRCRRLAKQSVAIVGHRRARQFRWEQELAKTPLILPGPDSDIRGEFDALCEQRGLQYRLRAEVDDMATMRLLARDSPVLAVLPAIVVRDEIRGGVLHELAEVPGVFESFYAITAVRRFQHPLLRELLGREEADLLGME